MSEPDWVEHAVWWQVYPLGFAGAYPAGRENGKLERVTAWLDYAVELGASGLLLGPVFAAETHHAPGENEKCDDRDPRLLRRESDGMERETGAHAGE